MSTLYIIILVTGVTTLYLQLGPVIFLIENVQVTDVFLQVIAFKFSNSIS